MRHLFSLLVCVALPGLLHAQATSVQPAEIYGHFLGESIAEFLSKEPDAQEEVNVCRAHRERSTCSQLLAALDLGKRAELSTSNSRDFILDGGRLVKLTVLVDESYEAVTADITKNFGPRSSETALPNKNAIEAKWENHLSVWETPNIHVTLFEDNNPKLQDHHLVLVFEIPAGHTREHSEASK
jgi:hypothetical protein